MSKNRQDIFTETESGTQKKCSVCGIWKPLEDYTKDKTSAYGVRSSCRTCLSLRAFRRTKEQNRKHHLKSKYQMSLEEYDDMYSTQGGCCAICGIPGDRTVLCVDHDHACCPQKDKSCGKCTRSLLCGDCNKGLGQFKDSPALLLTAIDYLQRHLEHV